MENELKSEYYINKFTNMVFQSLRRNVSVKHRRRCECRQSEKGKSSSSGHGIPRSLFGCAIVSCAFVIATWILQWETQQKTGRKRKERPAPWDPVAKNVTGPLLSRKLKAIRFQRESCCTLSGKQIYQQSQRRLTRN